MAHRRAGFPWSARWALVPSTDAHRQEPAQDRKSTRLNSSHRCNSYAVFCLKKKNIYHDQLILRDRIIPPGLIYGGAFFRREFMGATVPRDIYIHVCGTDLIRDTDGRYLVLEDNGRTPSGVSYMLQNRQVLKRVFPQVFEHYDVRGTDDYPAALLDVLKYIAPGGRPDPTVVLLSPGMYNSAHFEHTF